MKTLGKGFSPYAKVDKNGEYFCAKCGKAGFTERKKINGHIGGCNGTKDVLEELRGTTSSRGTTTTTTTTTPYSQALAAMTGGAVVGHLFGQASAPVMNSALDERIARIERLTSNHISHLSGEMGGFGDFFSKPIVKIGLGIIALVVVFYIIERGDSKSKLTMGNKLFDFAVKKL